MSYCRLRGAKTEYERHRQTIIPAHPPLPPGERDAESRVLIDRIGSSATDNTFDTLVRYPNLLRQRMPFTVALAVTGVLPSRLRELAILRTGWLCRAEYEWGQHVVLARRWQSQKGRSPGSRAAPRRRDGPSWRPQCSAPSTSSTPTPASPITPGRCSPHTSTSASSSRCAYARQYHIVSFTLNTLGIQREPGLGGFSG
jgi:4-carboxymuconolactone decarboxylase